MVELIIFILVAYGATNIMVFGSIFEGFRNFFVRLNPSFLGKLFTCMICLPTWWGFVLSLTMWSPTLSTGLINNLDIFSLTIDKVVLSTFFDGCLTSGVVWLIHTCQEYLEKD